jgi:PUA domain protein
LIPEQVDKGAIKFALSGANIMCPGLTSPVGKMTPCEKNQIDVITAEGKHHALAIGQTKLSTNDVFVLFSSYFKFNLFFLLSSSLNKGIAIEALHYLNDGLYNMKPIK